MKAKFHMYVLPMMKYRYTWKEFSYDVTFPERIFELNVIGILYRKYFTNNLLNYVGGFILNSLLWNTSFIGIIFNNWLLISSFFSVSIIRRLRDSVNKHKIYVSFSCNSIVVTLKIYLTVNQYTQIPKWINCTN